MFAGGHELTSSVNDLKQNHSDGMCESLQRSSFTDPIKPGEMDKGMGVGAAGGNRETSGYPPMSSVPPRYPSRLPPLSAQTGETKFSTPHLGTDKVIIGESSLV